MKQRWQERFWAKVDKSGGPDACWIRKAQGRATTRYARFRIGKQKMQATHVAWELTHGQIPAGLMVLHSCDNPPCVNPAHLFLGTAAMNSDDMTAKGRQATGDRVRPKDLRRGERHGMSKLTETQVLAIRSAYAGGGVSQPDLAARYNVTQANVWAVLHRKTWDWL